MDGILGYCDYTVTLYYILFGFTGLTLANMGLCN